MAACQIADQKFVKIGTYSNPVIARLNIPLLGGVQSSGYLIFGQAFENGDRKNNAKGTGLFTGYAFNASLGAAGSLGYLGFTIWNPFGDDLRIGCYPFAWAKFDYGMSIDVGLQINPISFDAAAEFHAGAGFQVGCANRSRGFANKQEIFNTSGIGIYLSADVSGHLRAFNPIAFDGSASVHVACRSFPPST